MNDRETKTTFVYLYQWMPLFPGACSICEGKLETGNLYWREEKDKDCLNICRECLEIPEVWRRACGIV